MFPPPDLINKPQEMIMSFRNIAVAAAFSSAVAFSGVARAQDAMSPNSMVPSPMAHDSMSKDAMAHNAMAPNAMSHNGMKKDAMPHGSMRHDNAMAAPQDSMAKPN